MASFNVVGMEDIMEAFQKEAERVERNGPAAAMAGSEAAVAAMEQTVPVRTGGLKGHLQIKGPFHSIEDGHYCDVFPSGKNERGERYETIGFVLEYGRSDNAPTAWMRTAVESNGEAISEAMAQAMMKD